ncbi:L,D-transpeptidase, partial [Patescibacteria group bacterium]|nr:L,D-transpeptidase [Patescibacteria group bacterium]
AGDLDSDSYPEIVTAPASMGGPHVRIFDGFGIPKINPGFFADELDYRLGVYISIKKFEQEGVPSISTIIKKEEQNIFKIFTPDGNLIRSYPVKEEENLSESIIIPIQLNNQALQLRLPKQTRAIDSNEKTIIIDLSDQKFSYYENGFRVNTFKTSTGGSGYKTPVGEYKILNKIDLAYSRAYGLYMPYWMQFTARGHGIHELPYWPSGHREGKNHLGTAVSHGCVRLGIGSAEEVYEWAQINTTVIVQE